MNDPDVKGLLDRHGYSFQVAFGERVDQLARERTFHWRVHAYEFPVATRQASTRVDLLLHNAAWNAYLACECKRVDPSLSHWLFARVPQNQWSPQKVLVDVFRGDGDKVRVSHEHLGSDQRPYHVGVVGRTRQAGDGTGSGRDQIEEAVTQSLRGTSGLLSFLARYHQTHHSGSWITVIPAVITTAELWVTDVNLGLADLETGRLTGEAQSTRVNWLWYQYHASPALRHDAPNHAAISAPHDALLGSDARTVAIVNATGIEEFFESLAR